MLSSIFLVYTGHVDHPRVLHLGGGVRRAEPLGYTTQRDLSAIGSFLIMGLIGLIIAIAGQHLPAESSGLDFVDLGRSAC